jgi:hypothetical protein
MEVNGIKFEKLFIWSLILFLIPLVNAADYEFKIWAEGPSTFTIGKEEMVNVYIFNNGTKNDSYAIDFTKEGIYQGGYVNHLIDVAMPSDQINFLGPNKTRDTFAVVTLLGPINSGYIQFNASSISDPSVKSSTNQVKLSTGYPVSLPEFGFIGVFVVMITARIRN